MPAPSIDIAIVNYRGVGDTLAALERLGQWPHGTVWVVDNSAHEADLQNDSAALCQACTAMPWVSMITPGKNLGFGRACNLAFAQSRSEYFLLLNPDARIAPDAVLRLAAVLVENPRLGAVSPKIYWNEQHSFVLPAAFPQTPWHSVALTLATHFPRTTQRFVRHRIQRSMQQMAGPACFEVPFLAGAVMLLRRAAVEKAGGLFDPAYFMFFEDSDLSLRLRRVGSALALVPAASAVHEYRHKASKATLMQDSHGQYYKKLFPAFYSLSRQGRVVAALTRPLPCARLGKVLSAPVGSAAEFAQLSAACPVIALSPSPLMMPAMFRPSMDAARCLDAQEWALLEPAHYVAWVQDADRPTVWSWIYFERGEPDC